MTNKEIRDGRQLVRELSPRSAGSDYALASALGVKEGAYPSIFEDTDFITFLKGLRIRHTTPEIRLEEVDQVDPAGRFRLISSGGSFEIQLSTAANWATSRIFFSHDASVATLQSLIDAGQLVFRAGETVGQRLSLTFTSSATQSMTLQMGVTNILQVLKDVTQDPNGLAQINVLSANLDMKGNLVKGLESLRGDGAAAVTLRSHAALTDATARRIALYALDPATDTEYIVANVVPDGAVPKFTMRAPDDAPSTTELDDEHVTFGYTKATDTITMYVREGAAVKSLVLGVAV